MRNEKFTKKWYFPVSFSMRNEKWEMPAKRPINGGTKLAYAFILKTPYNEKTSPRGNVGLSLSGRFERVAPAGSGSRLRESCGYRRSQWEIYHYSFGCTFISRIRELEKRRDALRAEPTNKAGAEPSDGAARAEPSSLELCRVATEFEELKLVWALPCKEEEDESQIWENLFKNLRWCLGHHRIIRIFRFFRCYRICHKKIF